MKLVDLHCDTIYELLRKEHENETLLHNSLCIDLEKMEQAQTFVKFFACFVNKKEHEAPEAEKERKSPFGTDICAGPDVWDRTYGAVLSMIRRLEQEQCGRLQIAHSYEEIIENQKKGMISAVITVEEGGVLNENIARLDELYKKGVRLITLTWNYENCIGYPNSRDVLIMEKGLKPFGIEAIEAMQRLGMLVDVSHLSDGGFWDCIRLCKKPIVASHSNVRALCSHPRNLTDEMLRALAEKGGAAGLNFYPAFLRELGRSAVVQDIARHAAYMIRTGGEDLPAIGTDFDGFYAETDDAAYIAHPGQIERVWDAMKKEGITERQIEKISSGNALRVIKDVLR